MNPLLEDYDTYALFISTLPYVLLASYCQNKHLNYLARLGRKSVKPTEVRAQLKSLKKRTPFILSIGIIAHILIYWAFAQSEFRLGYMLTVFLTYLLYVMVMLINFWLKGASVLKDTGESGSLPGN